MPGDMLTSREVAAYLGIHEKQVYRLLRDGRLPGTRVTGRWIFSRRQVREWIEACAREAVAPRGSRAAGPAVEPHHLVMVGSDDLLLQIVQRELNRRHPALLVTSAATSSAAGLEAVRDGRAHLAGIHLLDPATGEYNRAHVAQAFGRRRALLITLAHRQEGLILPRGNPRKVTGLADVVKLRLRLASRELGSGVRVLQDHLLPAARAGARRRAGRDLELATHLEVATAVAEGRADVGIGVPAPARSLGLEFVPLVWERYDLVTTDEAFYHRPTQTLFEMIKSDWLRQLVASMPGYDARETGLLSVVEPEDRE
ncbi:MAG: substrate-binding domain-containing protein [Kofleriaceae bacterium]